MYRRRPRVFRVHPIRDFKADLVRRNVDWFPYRDSSSAIQVESFDVEKRRESRVVMPPMQFSNKFQRKKRLEDRNRDKERKKEWEGRRVKKETVRVKWEEKER